MTANRQKGNEAMTSEKYLDVCRQIDADSWVEVSQLIEAITESDDLHERLRHREDLIEALKPIKARLAVLLTAA
jgi:hypothetical protein